MSSPALRRFGLALALAFALTVVASLGWWAGAAGAANSGNFPSIETQFMCVSCHEPLELVSSPQAISEKAYLQSLIKRGLTLGEIKSEMVGQYGEEVLAQPPASGFNLTVYVVPPAVALAGLLLLVYTLPRWRERSRAAATTALGRAAPLSAEESSRLDAELDQFM